MRSKTAVPAQPAEAIAIQRSPTTVSAGQPGVVGLAGLEPAPSSISGIEG